jgi:putative transcriptional regulator
LGAHLRVSRQTIIAIETGRYDPSLPLAFRIARLFQARIEEVFTPDPDAAGDATAAGPHPGGIR